MFLYRTLHISKMRSTYVMSQSLSHIKINVLVHVSIFLYGLRADVRLMNVFRTSLMYFGLVYISDQCLIKLWSTTVGPIIGPTTSWWRVYWLSEVLPIISWSDVIWRVLGPVKLTSILNIRMFCLWSFKSKIVRVKILFKESVNNRGFTDYYFENEFNTRK